MSEILIPKESEYILTAIYNEFLKTSKLTNHSLANPLLLVPSTE